MEVEVSSTVFDNNALGELVSTCKIANNYSVAIITVSDRNIRNHFLVFRKVSLTAP